MKKRELLGIFVAVLGLLAIPASVFWYYSDNIVGYYKFKGYCSKEAGLRISQAIKPKSGWIASDASLAKTAAALNGVDFARYTDEKKNSFDVRYLGGDVQRDSSFDVSRANDKDEVTYRIVFVNEELSGEIRMGKSGYEVFDINSGLLVARFYNFGYSIFDVNNTLFASPSRVACFSSPARYVEGIQKAIGI